MNKKVIRCDTWEQWEEWFWGKWYELYIKYIGKPKDEKEKVVHIKRR